MYLICRRLLAVYALALAMAAGCTSITSRSYNFPARYVSFAAREACLGAGFEVGSPPRIVEGEPRIVGNRPLNVGFFVGQGGESISVDVHESGSVTNVDIESEKQFLGFLAQRHMDGRIASFLESYLKENDSLRDRIVGGR